MKFRNLPSEVMLELTDRCNLDCEYCFRSKNTPNGNVLEFEKFRSIIQKIPFAEVISFCGLGEQLLHPKFYKMIEYVKSKNKKVAIITNGTIKIDYDKLVELGNIYILTFSIDGASEDDIKKICSKYKYSELIENLQRGTHYKCFTKAINCVLTNKNIENIQEIVDFCDKYSINKLNILLPSYNMAWITKNIEKITKKLNIIEYKAKKKGIIYSSPYKQYCLFNDEAIPFITTQGIIRPCCDHFNKILKIGNILEKNFEEFWNSLVYTEFREGKYCLTCKMYNKMPKLNINRELL